LNNNKLINPKLICAFCWFVLSSIMKMHGPKNKTGYCPLRGHNPGFFRSPYWTQHPRRHLYIMGLIDGPLCRRCGAEEETLAHVLCECKALVSLRHAGGC